MKLKNLKNETGQALLPVLALVLLFFLLSATALFSVAECRRAYLVEKSMIQARYIAESGVERALAEVLGNDALCQELLTPPAGGEITLFGGEAYFGGIISRVTIRKEEIRPPIANITITSVGLYEDCQKTMVVKARVATPPELSEGEAACPPGAGGVTIEIKAWEELYAVF